MKGCAAYMFINLEETSVVVISGRTDLRMGIDSLAYLIQDEYQLDPFSTQVFLFCGSKRDRFKALYWDGKGFCLFYRRFDNGKLKWPNTENEAITLSSIELDRLLNGFDIYAPIQEAKVGNFY